MRRRRWGTVRLVPPVLLALAGIAHGEADQFLSRDGNVSTGSTYLDSDGAVQSETPAEGPWDTFVEGKPPAEHHFELPGLWPIKRTSPAVQTLVAGPTFRNEQSRIEVGAGFAYVNSKWRLPFEFSVEPTWQRDKNARQGDRNFRRVRTFGLVELWDRSSRWESSSVAGTAFWDNQSNTFDTLEIGGAISETIGRRLSISADVRWGGDWPSGSDFNQAAIATFGTSYNLGAGVRVGGFVSYQFLPFAEINVNAGKNQFVGVKLMMSYALERP